MPIKKYKPTTPGRRGMTSSIRISIKPEKSLLAPLNGKGGTVTTMDVLLLVTKGGGHKRAYRIIDFKRNKMVSLLV